MAGTQVPRDPDASRPAEPEPLIHPDDMAIIERHVVATRDALTAREQPSRDTTRGLLACLLLHLRQLSRVEALIEHHEKAGTPIDPTDLADVIRDCRMEEG